MYLWHAIKPACLDREITPCLPTNKPPALLSGPLFIIHNLLWCQGQSDSIVMVKGTSADPELSTGIGNPGIQTNKQKKRNPLKSDGLDCNQRSAKDLQEAGKSDSAVNNPLWNTLQKQHAQRNVPRERSQTWIIPECNNTWRNSGDVCVYRGIETPTATTTFFKTFII